jgi:D-aspartate ligase
MTAVLLGDLNMLRCFVGADIPTVIAVSDSDATVLSSRFARSYRMIAGFDDPERAIADLEDIARDLPDRPVLFYGNDRQLLAISRHRDRLARTYRFTMPPPELVEVLVDKARFAERAEALGLPVPVTVAASEVTGVDELLARVRLPCVLKPTSHIGWFTHRALHADGPRKALIATTADQLRARYTEVARCTPDFLIQEYIPGGEDLIYSFHAYVDAAGTTLARFAGKKIRTFPREAGVSTYLGLVKEPRVLALGDAAVARLGLVGPLKIDLKMHAETGELYILEVNPRFNLWHYLGAASGINLPRIAYADLTGVPHEAPPTEYATDIHWLSFSDDLRSFLRSYHPAGELGWLGWLGSLRGRKVYDVFAWSDPLPWAASLLEHGRALGARLLGASRP